MPTIEQLKTEYEGEWLAILVTASDKFGATEGELFHHSKNRDDIARKVGEIPRGKRKDYDIAILYAGPPVPEDAGLAISFWIAPELELSSAPQMREKLSSH